MTVIARTQLQALHDASMGETLPSKSLEVVADFGRLEAAGRQWKLTSRQLEVLAYLVQGKSNREMAELFQCSERTVEVHVTQILKRSKASNRTEVIARYWGTSP